MEPMLFKAQLNSIIHCSDDFGTETCRRTIHGFCEVMFGINLYTSYPGSWDDRSYFKALEKIAEGFDID